MALRYQVAGLIIICAVIVIHLLASGPFRIFRELIEKRWKSAGASSSTNVFSFESKTSSGAPRLSIISEAIIIIGNQQKDEYFFAPIIIGAGQGTTGTHLFTEVTCQLGFVSLHWRQGCVPPNIIPLEYSVRRLSKSNGSDTINMTASRPRNSQETPCSKVNDGYSTLIRHQYSAIPIFNFKNKNNMPALFRDKILEHLEGVIVWGKEHKVALAIHDTPYPHLMPEIIKLVQRHYGKLAKPIILLSERDPQEWAASRIKNHEKDTICLPTQGQLGMNSSTPIVNPMNTTTLEGGAFGIIACIDRAMSAHNVSVATDKIRSAAPQLSQIFYTVKDADQLQHRQFIVDTMDDYQNAVRGHSVFSYNMFDKENTTSADDLAALVKESMVKALQKTDGSIRMEEGLDFLGFDHFFDNTDRFSADDRITHRRRNHGDIYDEKLALDGERSTAHGEIAKDALMTNDTIMVPVSFFKKHSESIGKLKCRFAT